MEFHLDQMVHRKMAIRHDTHELTSQDVTWTVL